MAGHSKFKNIMHRKGAQDKKRAKLFSRLIREISVSAKLGGVDSSSNPRLRAAINNALSSNMSKENIERAIKKTASSGESDQILEITYEGFGPSGVAIIVDSLTDNKNRSVSEIRSTFSKYNGNLGISGCVKHFFKKTGVILYSKEIANFEKIFEFCANINALDVLQMNDSYEITTEIESFHNILSNLEKEYSVPNFSSIEWRPVSTIDIDNENDAATLLKLLEKLEELDDVQNVASNFNINDELMEKII